MLDFFFPFGLTIGSSKAIGTSKIVDKNNLSMNISQMLNSFGLTSSEWNTVATKLENSIGSILEDRKNNPDGIKTETVVFAEAFRYANLTSSEGQGLSQYMMTTYPDQNLGGIVIYGSNIGSTRLNLIRNQ